MTLSIFIFVICLIALCVGLDSREQVLLQSINTDLNNVELLFKLGQLYRYELPCHAIHPLPYSSSWCYDQSLKYYLRVRELVQTFSLTSFSFDYIGMLNDLALMLSDKGYISDAILIYKEAIQLQPTAINPIMNLASLYSSLEDISQADFYYLQAIHLITDKHTPSSNTMNTTTDTTTTLQVPIIANNSKAIIYYNYGVFKYKLQLILEAQYYWNLSVTYNIHMSHAWSNLATLSCHSGDFNTSRQYYEKSIAEAIRTKNWALLWSYLLQYYLGHIPIISPSESEVIRIRNLYVKHIYYLLSISPPSALVGGYMEIDPIDSIGCSAMGYYIIYHGYEDIYIRQMQALLYYHVFPILQSGDVSTIVVQDANKYERQVRNNMQYYTNIHNEMYDMYPITSLIRTYNILDRLNPRNDIYSENPVDNRVHMDKYDDNIDANILGINSENNTTNNKLSTISSLNETITAESSNSSSSSSTNSIIKQRIKIGFLSAYFYRHSVGLLLQGVIKHLNPSYFEVIIISINTPAKYSDHITEQLKHSSYYKIPSQCQYLSFHGKLAVIKSSIQALNLDILIYGEIGMDSMTYFLSFSTLAKRTLFFWGHATSSGITNIPEIYKKNKGKFKRKYQEWKDYDDDFAKIVIDNNTTTTTTTTSKNKEDSKTKSDNQKSTSSRSSLFNNERLLYTLPSIFTTGTTDTSHNDTNTTTSNTTTIDTEEGDYNSNDNHNTNNNNNSNDDDRNDYSSGPDYFISSILFEGSNNNCHIYDNNCNSNSNIHDNDDKDQQEQEYEDILIWNNRICPDCFLYHYCLLSTPVTTNTIPQSTYTYNKSNTCTLGNTTNSDSINSIEHNCYHNDTSNNTLNWWNQNIELCTLCQQKHSTLCTDYTNKIKQNIQYSQLEYSERLLLMNSMTTYFERPVLPLSRADITMTKSSNTNSGTNDMSNMNHNDDDNMDNTDTNTDCILSNFYATLPHKYDYLLYLNPELSDVLPSKNSSFHLYGLPQTLYKLHPDFDRYLLDILCQDYYGYIVMPQSSTYEQYNIKVMKRLRRTLTTLILTDMTFLDSLHPLYKSLMNSISQKEAEVHVSNEHSINKFNDSNHTVHNTSLTGISTLTLQTLINTILSHILFVRHMNEREYITLCAISDLILDPFPVGGGRSSLEIFSVGTPIIMLKPRTSILQLTYAMYVTMGIQMTEKCCIAYTRLQYVYMALYLATHDTYRLSLRSLLLQRNYLLYENKLVLEEWEKMLLYIISTPRPRPHPHSSFSSRIQNISSTAFNYHSYSYIHYNTSNQEIIGSSSSSGKSTYIFDTITTTTTYTTNTTNHTTTTTNNNGEKTSELSSNVYDNVLQSNSLWRSYELKHVHINHPYPPILLSDIDMAYMYICPIIPDCNEYSYGESTTLTNSTCHKSNICHESNPNIEKNYSHNTDERRSKYSDERQLYYQSLSVVTDNVDINRIVFQIPKYITRGYNDEHSISITNKTYIPLNEWLPQKEVKYTASILLSSDIHVEYNHSLITNDASLNSVISASYTHINVTSLNTNFTHQFLSSGEEDTAVYNTSSTTTSSSSSSSSSSLSLLLFHGHIHMKLSHNKIKIIHMSLYDINTWEQDCLSALLEYTPGNSTSTSSIYQNDEAKLSYVFTCGLVAKEILRKQQKLIKTFTFKNIDECQGISPTLLTMEVHEGDDIGEVIRSKISRVKSFTLPICSSILIPVLESSQTYISQYISESKISSFDWIQRRREMILSWLYTVQSYPTYTLNTDDTVINTATTDSIREATSDNKHIHVGRHNHSTNTDRAMTHNTTAYPSSSSSSSSLYIQGLDRYPSTCRSNIKIWTYNHCNAFMNMSAEREIQYNQNSYHHYHSPLQSQPKSHSSRNGVYTYSTEDSTDRYNYEYEYEVILGMTTCKRLSLFLETISSLELAFGGVGSLPNRLITKVIIVDDGSSIEDRAMMIKTYPNFIYIFKSSVERGHAYSMNILVTEFISHYDQYYSQDSASGNTDMQRRYIYKYPYFMYLEDDWKVLSQPIIYKPLLDIMKTYNKHILMSNKSHMTQPDTNITNEILENVHPFHMLLHMAADMLYHSQQVHCRHIPQNNTFTSDDVDRFGPPIHQILFNEQGSRECAVGDSTHCDQRILGDGGWEKYITISNHRVHDKTLSSSTFGEDQTEAIYSQSTETNSTSVCVPYSFHEFDILNQYKPSSSHTRSVDPKYTTTTTTTATATTTTTTDDNSTSYHHHTTTNIKTRRNHDFSMWPGFSLNPGLWDLYTVYHTIATCMSDTVLYFDESDCTNNNNNTSSSSRSGATAINNYHIDPNTSRPDHSSNNHKQIRKISLQSKPFQLFHTQDLLFEQRFSMTAYASHLNMGYFGTLLFQHIGINGSAYQLNDLKRPWE